MLGYTWPRGARNQIKYPQIHEIRKLHQSSNKQSTLKSTVANMGGQYRGQNQRNASSKQLPLKVSHLKTINWTPKQAVKLRITIQSFTYIHSWALTHTLIFYYSGSRMPPRATLINSSSCRVFFRFFTKCEAFLAVWWIECLRKPLPPVLWKDQRPGQECDSDRPLPLP